MIDNIKSLKIKDWLNLIPCKLYNKKENKSYLIMSLSKEGLYYTKEIEVEDNDDFGWSPYYTVDTSVLLKFKELTNDFIIGDEPTKKQIEWLENHHKMTKSMTKQEAWEIINKTKNDLLKWRFKNEK